MKYYDIMDANGKHCHPQFLTEKMVENMRARGFKLRLATEWRSEFK